MPRYFGIVFYERASGVGTQPAGWSEVYPLNSSGYVSAFSALDNLNTLRLAMATADVTALASRVSDSDILRDSYVAALTTQTGTFTGAVSGDPDDTRRVKFLASQLKRTVRHIHALPGPLFTNGIFIPSGAWTAAETAWANAVVTNVSIATNLHAANPPHYTFTSITGFLDYGNGNRKVGRPFGQPRGRRSIV